MPALSFPTADFVPFTKILSADMNGKFNAIKTLLNTTGLDDTNIQAAGITRATKLKAGTASYVVINDGTGAMSEEQYLSQARGGLGFNATTSASNASQVVAVNASGTGLQLQVVPDGNSAKIYSFFRFS